MKMNVQEPGRTLTNDESSGTFRNAQELYKLPSGMKL